MQCCQEIFTVGILANVLTHPITLCRKKVSLHHRQYRRGVAKTKLRTPDDRVLNTSHNENGAFALCLLRNNWNQQRCGGYYVSEFVVGVLQVRAGS